MSLGRTAVIAYHSSPLNEPGTGDSGGMTVYVRGVAGTLARRGIATDIFTRSTMEVGGNRELMPGVRVISIEAGPMAPIPKEEQPRYIDDFVAGIRAFSLAQRTRYDLVHSHYWQSGLAGTELSRAWGTPLVHSNHTLGLVKNLALTDGDGPEPSIRLEGEHRVMKGSDVLVASTDEELEHLACLYRVNHDKLKVIHPGVDHDLFYPGDRSAARARLGWSDRPVILYAGRIQKLKGIDLAIRALAHLSRGSRQLPLLVVAGGASGAGGNVELDRLRRLADSEGVDHLVRFVGPQPQPVLADMYRAADVVVICSHTESFGLAALEAHACGTPVVGTAVGGLSHIVSHGTSGWLVPDRDPERFAHHIATIIEDRELRKRFSAEAASLSRRSSWDSTTTELESLYECLIREQLAEACTC